MSRPARERREPDASRDAGGPRENREPREPVSESREPRAWRTHLAAAAVYLLLALWAVFPLWLHPASRIEAYDDPLLNAYLLDWSHFALLHHIGEYFQATYFWPCADSLAYGEILLAPALLAFPFRLFTSSAAAIHNFSLIQAFFFSALGAYALGWRLLRDGPSGGGGGQKVAQAFSLCMENLTASQRSQPNAGGGSGDPSGARAMLPRAAGAFAVGLAYGFAPYRLAQSNHIQLAHSEFLPLALLALEGLIETLRADPASFDPRRARACAAGLFAAAAGQWLTSWYWAVFSGLFLAAWIAVRAWDLRREMTARRAAWVAAPLALAALAALGMGLPTLKLGRSGALIRPPEASAGMSARPGDFLRAHSRAWLAPPAWTARSPGKTLGATPTGIESFAEASKFRERCLFPGFALGALSLLGAAAAARTLTLRSRSSDYSENSDFPAAAIFAATLLSLALAFGPRLNGIPLASEMRVPARWMLPAWMGLALWVGFAVRAAFAAGLSAAPAGRAGRIWRGAALSALALAFAESLPAPMRPVEIPSEPGPALRWLAEQPWPTPYLELPLSPLIDNRPLLRATWTHQPLMNGSNGYIPPGQLARLGRANEFPKREAIEELRSIGVRQLLVARPHPGGGDNTAAQLDAIHAEPQFRGRTHDFEDFIVVDVGLDANAAEDNSAP